MSVKIAGAIVLGLLATSLAFADRPAPERQYVITSPNGMYTFEMVPLRGQVAATEAHGKAGRVSADGTREILWSVKGWYSQQTFIADDGHSLVRIGPWAEGPVDAQLAVAFYRDGSEIRRYSVGDLIEDEASLEHSVSHYRWQAVDKEFPRLIANGQFELRTIEDVVKTFDMATGALLPIGQSASTPAEWPTVTRVTREDADDLDFAMNRFRENGIEMDVARINRISRDGMGSAKVWVQNEYAGLPVFSSSYYTFDSHMRVLRDEQSGEVLLRGAKLPPPNLFPIDHRADVTSVAAIDTWRKAIREDELLDLDFEPRRSPVATLGFSNRTFSGTAKYKLVWRVAPDGGRIPEARIDAKTGGLLYFDSVVRTGLEPTTAPANASIGLAGTWVGNPCGNRQFTRTLILSTDGTLQVLDRTLVTFRGSWSVTRPDWLVLETDSQDVRGVEPLPRHFGFMPDSGTLHEATPGGQKICSYSRNSTESGTEKG